MPWIRRVIEVEFVDVPYRCMICGRVIGVECCVTYWFGPVSNIQEVFELYFDVPRELTLYQEYDYDSGRDDACFVVLCSSCYRRFRRLIRCLVKKLEQFGTVGVVKDVQVLESEPKDVTVAIFDSIAKLVRFVKVRTCGRDSMIFVKLFDSITFRKGEYEKTIYGVGMLVKPQDVYPVKVFVPFEELLKYVKRVK